MSLFKRKRQERSPEAPPSWADYLEPERWVEFSALVSAHAELRGWEYDIEEGVIRGSPSAVPLGPVADMCNHESRDDWPVMISGFLDSAATREPSTLSRAEQQRASLKAVLVDDAALDIEFEYEVAHRGVADRLDLVLAYDFIEVHEVPSREDVLELGSEDELFALALEQTRAQTDDPEHELDLELRDFPNPDGSSTPIWHLSSYSPFTATHGLWADTLDPPPSEHGTLVAMPTRHIVLAHPIRDLGVVSAVNHLLGLSSHLAAADAGTLVDGIYWLRDGRLERLETRLEGDRMQFVPSEAFLRVLNSLG